MKIAKQKARIIKGRHRSTTGRKLRRSLLAAFVLMAMATAAVFYMARPRPAEAVSFGIVISQVYGGAGCGTAGCSTYQNDYIELFNRSKTAVTCTGCSVQYAAATGTAWQVTALPSTLTLQPGQYYLVAESSSANGVSPIPTPDTSGTIAMSATAAKVALVNSTTALSGSCPTLNGTGSPAVLDLVGYGATASCFEGAGPAPAPSTTTADVRAGGGGDTDNNSADFTATTPNPHNTASTAGTPTARGSVIRGQITTDNGSPLGGVTVALNGSTSARTITDSRGFYYFDTAQTSGFYTVTPSRANYQFSPAELSFSLVADKTDALFTATAIAPTGNPLEDSSFFVRQHYLDFLGREPDIEGLRYWTAQLDSCGTDAGCLRQRRSAVSAAFFLSQEFHDTGFFVYNMYKGSYGARPAFSEFAPDREKVVGGTNLAQSKQQFAAEWVGRESFRAAYPETLSQEQFVSKLMENAGLNSTALRSELVAQMQAGKSRADVLQTMVESREMQDKESSSAFVLMQYFGYLRREAETGGFDFWLNVLSNREQGNYQGMVCSFITSAEYQERFAPVAVRSNSECGR